jgi:hypothetical protein
MKIEIDGRKLDRDAGAMSRMKKRVSRTLSRLAHRIDSVFLRLESLGSRGAQECQVVLRLRDGGEVKVRQSGLGVIGPAFQALRQARRAALWRSGREV